MKHLFAVLLAFYGVLPPLALALEQSEVPKKKHTSLGLYLNAKEAYEMLQSKKQKNVYLLDVRTPEEYFFVGHAEEAINIPFSFMEYRYNEQKKKPVMKSNPSFVAEVKKRSKKDDVLIVSCRSGKRSTKSVEALSKAGFKKVYNLVDGFEGDLDKKTNSPTFGQRTVNGWKNAELPWTYSLSPKQMYLETGQGATP